MNEDVARGSPVFACRCERDADPADEIIEVCKEVRVRRVFDGNAEVFDGFWEREAGRAKNRKDVGDPELGENRCRRRGIEICDE